MQFEDYQVSHGDAFFFIIDTHEHRFTVVPLKPVGSRQL